MTTRILPSMTPLRNVSQINEGDRFFYEVGYRHIHDNLPFEKDLTSYPWIATGHFQEIINIKDWIEKDKFTSVQEYLEHHNFMLIKKQQWKDNPMRVSSSANSPNRTLLYLTKPAIDTLLSISSRTDIVSGRVTEDELPAIAILSDVDERRGHAMRFIDENRVQVSAMPEDVPVGQYIMDREPIFEDGMDWFVLRRVEE